MAIFFAAAGTNDHITTNFTANTGSGFQSFSVSAWIYMNTIDPFDYRNIVFIHATNRKITGLTLSPAGAINFGNETVDLVGPVLRTGIWIYACSSAFATSQTSAKVRGYMNGSVVASGVVASGAYGGQAAYDMTVGATTDTSSVIDGYIEDVRFWTRSLTATEVMRDYRSSLADRRGMIGWNPLRDGYLRDQSATASSQGNATWTSAGTAPTVVVSSLSATRGTNRWRASLF